ncbi:Diaminopimelate epimerase [Lachnospiraceae bacterium TWA4]|nr:Diaminopimelate epimerase [Lachnospiraceae bacterium TWA4]
MKFTKMHGIGNDYVYVNCFEETVEEPSRVAQLVSDRHFSIGSDGLILIKPSKVADFCMDMYNADGSRGAMCGNGIRCVGKYVYDHGLTNMTTITVETGAGIKTLKLNVVNGRVVTVTVDMGLPVLTSNHREIDLRPEVVDGLIREEIWEELVVDEKPYKVINISMGNPHTVLFIENVDDLAIETIGPSFENHERFKDRTNTEFIQIVDDSHLKMRVWERGSGETMACGTGACASAVAASLAGFIDKSTDIRLLGGTLQISIDEETGHVFMTGPATEVFEGTFNL